MGERCHVCLLLVPQLNNSMRCLPTPQPRSTGVTPTPSGLGRGHTCDSNRLQSIQTPFPVFSLEIKAAMIAPWAYKPVAMSVLATPTYSIVMWHRIHQLWLEQTLHGGPSGSPVLAQRDKLVVGCEDYMELHCYICISPAGVAK